MDIILIISGILASILAGMGIGGGAVFVFLTTNLSNIPQKEAQVLNLILFISVSISVMFFSLKNKKIKFNLFKKILPCLVLGSFVGTKCIKFITDESLKLYFTVFLLLLGLYEIISSLFFNKQTKNNNEK